MDMENYEYDNQYSGRCLDDDSLQHWKYIKREKVNGKWRYWYENDKKKSKVITVQPFKDVVGTREVLTNTKARPKYDNSANVTIVESPKRSGVFEDFEMVTDVKTDAYGNKTYTYKKPGKLVGHATTIKTNGKPLSESNLFKTDNKVAGSSKLKDISKTIIENGKNAVADMLDKMADRLREK